MQISYHDYEKLFTLVRKNPILYDTSTPNYRSFGHTKRIWNSIADTMGIEGMDAAEWKKKWKNQRDTYLKKRKERYAVYGTKKPSVKPWKFSGHLEFLDHFTELPEDKSNQNPEIYNDSDSAIVEYENSFSNDTVIESPDEEDHLSVYSCSSASPTHEETITVTDKFLNQKPDFDIRQPDDEPPSTILNFLEGPKRTKEEDPSQDQQTTESAFFQSCSQRIMELPKQTRGLLMLQIQQLFFNAENPNLQVPITSLMPP